MINGRTIKRLIRYKEYLL